MDTWNAMEELAERYIRLTNLSFDSVVIYGEDARILFVNDSGLAMMGATRDQLIGQLIGRFALPEYAELLAQRMRFMFAEGRQTEPAELRIRTVTGDILDVEVTGIAIPYEGRPAILAIIRDITPRKRYEREIEHLAYHDSLTGLPNRRWFDRNAPLLLQRCERAGRSAGMMFLGFDLFKHVNDSFGHQFGDLLLQEIAQRLHEETDERRLVIRMGGDEFTLLLLDMDDEDEIVRWSERVMARLRKPIRLLDVPFHATCSIGIAVFPQDGATPYKLLKSADIALHRAKLLRNCAIRYEPRMELDSINRMTVMDDLHKALEHGWFELHYQPQVDLRSGRLQGAEALLRMKHPQKGLLAPDYFIPVAESSSMIIPIGDWSIREACEQSVRWRKKGLGPFPVSVNVAMRQFQEDAFVDKVVRSLEDTGLAPELLELEITESCAADSQRLGRVLRDLKPLGVRVSIDDFGTGYSSLSQLSSLNIDKLKIDRSFIVRMTEHERDENLVRTIIAMAHNLQMQVVAEGMETQEQVEKLRDWGCDTAQGYYFAKPVPSEALFEMVRGTGV